MDKQEEKKRISEIITRLRNEQERLGGLTFTKDRHKLYATYASLESGLNKILKNIKN